MTWGATASPMRRLPAVIESRMLVAHGSGVRCSHWHQVKGDKSSGCSLVLMRPYNLFHEPRSIVMSTLPPASSTEHLCEVMREMLTDGANRLARPTGQIVRQRKFSGALFAQLLVLGWLHDPHAILESLVQFGATLHLSSSAQGLDERFNVPAAAFLRALMASAIGQVI